MLEVYNHLITAYQPKYLSTHQADRKETKNVYRSILSINKQSPLYKINLTDDTQSFALSVKNAALSLKYGLEELNDSETSAFEKRKIISSDKDTAEVKVLNNNAAVKSGFKELSLSVSQLARPQINKSYSVPSNDISPLSGSYSFTIDIKDSLYEYQFQIGPDSTNHSIFAKLSDFINKSDVGLSASVSRSKTNGTSALTLASDSTGNIGEPLFYIADSDKVPKLTTMGIISFYGLDRTTQTAENAIIEINGEPKETLGNNFVLNKSLSVTLHGRNDNPVTIQAVPDEDAIIKELGKTLSNFNNLIDLASANKGNLRSAKLFYDLSSITARSSENLSNAGIQQDEIGHLSFDPEKAPASAAAGQLQKLFSPESRFYNDLSRTATSISLNPMDYVDKTIVSYPNTSVPGSISPYSTSMYSGMLFNYYC